MRQTGDTGTRRSLTKGCLGVRFAIFVFGASNILVLFLLGSFYVMALVVTKVTMIRPFLILVWFKIMMKKEFRHKSIVLVVAVVVTKICITGDLREHGCHGCGRPRTCYCEPPGYKAINYLHHEMLS
jgi:hypothetical protein